MGARPYSVRALTGQRLGLVGICLLVACAVFAQSGGLRSPDGKYQAMQVGAGSDRHYQVKEVGTDRVVLTTQAQYRTPNDVKAGLFGAEGKEFAAAYHYGHEGSYTWIGIWSLETGQLVRTERKSGWTTDMASVFKK